MDPVTHFLTGACLGRAGLNRKTAYATLAATLAAEAPDIDVAWGWGGPVVGFAHHRGITHTLIGAPFMAAAVVLLIYAGDRTAHAIRTRRGKAAEPSRARHSSPPFILQAGHPERSEGSAVSLSSAAAQTPPWHWGWLFTTALFADFTHLLLDWTNNYGIRPFFPWNPRWYSLDLVFIIEPILILLFAGALLLPSVFALVDREIAAKRPLFRGRGLALAALTGAVLLWTLRFAEHGHALALANQAGALGREPLLRTAAEPYPFNPFRWHVIAETRDNYLQAEVWTLGDRLQSADEAVPKAPVTEAVAAAKASYLGRVYESWSTWPLTEDLGLMPIPGQDVPTPQTGWATVRFSDMRFRYGILANQGETAPLAAWAYADEAGSVQAQVMSGKLQR